ncbi:MAG TPA: NDP-sugar synthase [Actinomycetota bacterium]|nr:NDP-sugar synthase [Actinomycetota bacterium]
MKAVVLVGGEGTRLRPLTETIPKPLLPFMNRPFLDHVLDHLAGHGVDEVVLSSSYLESEFREYLEGRAARPAVTWITEERPLGTSGAVAGARDLLDETFFVLNGDVLSDLDLGSLLAFHRERRAVATIALHRVEDARPFGLVETADDGRVTAFREKPADPIPADINAGTYVLEPRALAAVPIGVAVSIERETYPALIEAGEPVFAMVAGGYWRDLGTPAAYLQAHMDALEGRVGGRTYPRPLLAGGARVDPSAEIGHDVVLGPEAAVGPRAKIVRSVVHRAATVGAEAVVEGAILGPRVAVGPGARVRGGVLAEGAVVERGAELADEALPPGAVAPA